MAERNPDYVDTDFFRQFLAPAITGVSRGDDAALITAVREELARIAFSDIGDLVEFGPGGVTVKDSTSVGRGARAAVGKVEYRESKHGTPIIVISTWPKPKALELLARHLGMLVDRMSLEVNETRARAFARKFVDAIMAAVTDPDARAAIQEQLAKLEAAGDA